MSAFEPTLIKTKRLTMRWLTMHDAPALFAIFANKEAARYLSMPAWDDISKAEESIKRDEREHQTGDSLRFGVTLNATGELIGVCQIFKVHALSRRAECGYTIAQQHWQQGYAFEVMRGFIDYCFDTLKLNRLEADIDPANAASARLLQKLGFSKEGVLRERWIVAGVVSDSWLYGLLAAEWAAKKS